MKNHLYAYPKKIISPSDFLQFLKFLQFIGPKFFLFIHPEKRYLWEKNEGKASKNTAFSSLSVGSPPRSETAIVSPRPFLSWLARCSSFLVVSSWFDSWQDGKFVMSKSWGLKRWDFTFHGRQIWFWYRIWHRKNLSWRFKISYYKFHKIHLKSKIF